MITIATVTYNAARTLERTLLSVETQEMPDIQHIIMDGGSKDGTLDIANAYKERVAGRYEVTIVSERDGGLYDAMNKALRLAKGDYICFLNAGDKLHAADTLSLVSHEANINKVGVIYGDTDIVDDEGNRLRGRRLTPPATLTWRSFKEGMLVCHQSFYVNRLIAQQYNLKYRFSADIDWCIRCMKEGERRGMKNVRITPSTPQPSEAISTEQSGFNQAKRFQPSEAISTERSGFNASTPLSDYLAEGMTTANHRASLIERFRIMADHYGTFSTVIQHIWFFIRALIKR